MTDAPRADLWHSWLPLVVPAGARTFRVSDRALAATLEDAGGELRDEEPDVEIAGDARVLRGAPLAAVTLDGRLPRVALRPLRIAERALGSLALARRAHAARAELRRLGYARTDVLMWDPGRAPHFWGAGGGAVRSAVAGNFPLRAVAIGSERGEPTLVDAARSAAGVGEPERTRAHGGLAMVFTRDRVLRVAVGPAAHKLERQEGALAALRALDPPASVAERVPWPLANGSVGIAHWVLEPLLHGTQPHEESARVLDDCVDFLVDLFRAGTGDGVGHSPAVDADVVATAASDEQAAALRALGRRVEERVGRLPRGFAHGDFWASNLLVDGGRLVGVVDWEAATDGALPLLDLFQLLVAPRLPAEEEAGDGFVRRLLPLVRAGGDARIRSYCARVGIDVDQETLEALAVAFWLDRVGYGIAHYDHASRWRRDWVERNVVLPARELARTGLLG